MRPALERYGDFAQILDEADAAAWMALLRAGSTGRPIGSVEWVEALEQSSGRQLLPQRRGRNPRRAAP